MQPYDLLMIVVLGGATLFGAMKGMAWQFASLGSIAASYFVALKFSEPLAPVFHAQAPWNRFLAMLVLYVLTSFAVWLAFRIVAGAIDRVRLKDFDRQIGALIGAFKGVLICVAITFFAVTLSVQARGSVLKSKSGTYIAKLLNKADSVMPAELHEVLDPYLDRLERGLDPNEPNPATAGEYDSLREGFSEQVRGSVERAAEGTWRKFSNPGRSEPHRLSDRRSWDSSDSDGDDRYEDDERPRRRFESTAEDSDRGRYER